MARQREFDEKSVLEKAIAPFCERGYSATSTEDLVHALGIGRQSMYGAFGGKHALFLRAIALYIDNSAASLRSDLERTGSPVLAIRAALVSFAERCAVAGTKGCMAINALAEFGTRDADVNKIVSEKGRLQRGVLLAILHKAQKAGEISPSDRLEPVADFFDGTLIAIKMAAKAGKGRRALSDMARIAGYAIGTRTASTLAPTHNA